MTVLDGWSCCMCSLCLPGTLSAAVLPYTMPPPPQHICTCMKFRRDAAAQAGSV
jgi:hypothetical protein